MFGFWTIRNAREGKDVEAEGAVHHGLDELMDGLVQTVATPPTQPNEWTYHIRFIAAKDKDKDKDGVKPCEAVEALVDDMALSEADLNALEWTPFDNGAALPTSDAQMRVLWDGEDCTVSITELGQMLRTIQPDRDIKVGFVPISI